MYKLLFLLLLPLLLSCSKQEVDSPADDLNRTATVRISTAPGFNEWGNNTYCWAVILNFDKPVNTEVTARVKWHCSHVVGQGSVYYDETFTVNCSSTVVQYTTNKQAHQSYTADQVQLVTITAPGYNF